MSVIQNKKTYICPMFIKVEGFNIHYQIIGNEWIKDGSDLLVFMHEGLGSIPQWKDFPSKLSEELQIPALVYERIGYGKSDFWDNEEIKSKFLHYEADVIFPKLLEELNIQNNIILFGHSDGGTTALLHSSLALPQLKATIIEAPHTFLEEHSIQGIKNARKILDNKKVIQVMNRYHSGRAYELIDKWTAHWLGGNIVDWDAEQRMKDIEIPLLLIQGDNDEFGTFAQIERVAESAKSKIIEIHKITDCGHIPHLEKQNEIIAISKNFINNINNNTNG